MPALVIAEKTRELKKMDIIGHKRFSIVARIRAMLLVGSFSDDVYSIHKQLYPTLLV